MVDIVANVQEILRLFTGVATNGPLEFVLLVTGLLFLGASSLVFGYLSVLGFAVGVQRYVTL